MGIPIAKFDPTSYQRAVLSPISDSCTENPGSLLFFNPEWNVYG